jgi:hypothetical protein
MCDFAAGLADRVIPHVPVRQWVLTVPHGLRGKLAFDPALTSVVLRQFIVAVSAWLRRRARRLGVGGALKSGAVTVIQRFNSAVDLSVHYHALFLDGAYSFPPGRKPVFHPTPAPTDEDVARVVAAVFRRIESRLANREPDAAHRRFIESAPVLAAVADASARGIVATGPRRGGRIVRIRGAPADVDAFVMGKLCAQVDGYNLQAATRIGANDRKGLERMARYLARPPIASDRLSQLDDGRLELRLKRAWRDGTTAFVFTPHEIIERLVAIVPRPRAHLTRYFGVLAPAFAARSGIVPAEAAVSAPAPRAPRPAEPNGRRRPGRVSWASLIWRVFLNDVLECGRCGGHMESIAAVTTTEAVTRILENLGLPSAPTTFHSARPPPQTEFPFAADGFGAAPPASNGFEPDPPVPDDFGA